MSKTIEELESDLCVMNEMFRKYIKISMSYQKQINDANISEERRRTLLEKLSNEDEKVLVAKKQIEKFEHTIEMLKRPNHKSKTLRSCKEDCDYLIAYI